MNFRLCKCQFDLHKDIRNRITAYLQKNKNVMEIEKIRIKFFKVYL